MKKKFYKYGLFYIGVVLAACADNADLNEPTEIGRASCRERV